MSPLKKIPARTYFVVTCNAHDGNYRILDENKSPYHATRMKAERLAAEHSLSKHITIATKKVRVRRTTTVEMVEEIK